jgi:phage terminase small subunit
MAMRLTPKRVRFINFYFNEAQLNATEAARLAGFGSPETRGPQLKRVLREFIEKKEVELREAALISPRECQERLAYIARNAPVNTQLKALEMVAKIHGLFSEKVHVEMNRGEIEKSLLETLEQIKTNELSKMSPADKTRLASIPLN